MDTAREFINTLSFNTTLVKVLWLLINRYVPFWNSFNTTLVKVL